MPKTNAEYCRDYRRKRRENKIKKTAKRSTERVREFRARQKALLNVENDTSITQNDDFTVQNSESDNNSVEKIVKGRRAAVAEFIGLFGDRVKKRQLDYGGDNREPSPMDLANIKVEEEIEIKTESSEEYYIDIANLKRDIAEQELLHDEVVIKDEVDEAIPVERALMEEVNIKDLDEPIRKRLKRSSTIPATAGDGSDQDNVPESSQSASKATQPSTSTITNEEANNSKNSEIHENTETPKTRREFKKKTNRSRSSHSEVMALKNLQIAIRIFEETIRKIEAPPDDIDIYAMGLANKLRAFSEIERLEIMYEIDGMLIRRRRAKDL